MFRRAVPDDVAASYREAGWWGDATLSDSVSRWASERAGDPAFLTVDGAVSWAEYDQLADELAVVLVDSGLHEGDRLAVWLPDGPTVHIAYLAAERAGITVVGIGTRAGERELAHLLRKTKAVAVMSHTDHRGASVRGTLDAIAADLPHLRRHITVPRPGGDTVGPIAVDGVPLEPSGLEAAAVRGRRLGPDDLFLINTTSGTTGMPKCVMHTQNRWMYFHSKAVQHARLGDEVVLGAVPAPFGFGLWTSHFTPALLGCPTVLRETFDPTECVRMIERHRVTMLCCVSTQFIMILNSGALDRHDVSSLRVMFTGGEAIPYDRAAAFEAQTGATVLQFFGSNETGLLTGTTLDDPIEKRLRTAGRPVPEMELRLFDGTRDVTASRRGQPAGRGPATCLGYLDDDEANGALFTADGWMLMGDICEIDDDGYLRVVGRTADIIIRGGKNISAGQVEDEVATHPSVVLAAVVPFPDPVFGERVCVFVESAEPDLTLADVVEHLRRRGTSKELFPERLVVLGELPRASGGKVAKGVLRSMAADSQPPTP